MSTLQNRPIRKYQNEEKKVLNRILTMLGCGNDDAEQDKYMLMKDSVKPRLNQSKIPQQFPAPPAGSILGLIAKSNATGVSIREVVEETVITRRKTVTFFLPKKESELEPRSTLAPKKDEDDEFSVPGEVFVMESEDEEKEDHEEERLVMVRSQTSTYRRRY
jgi:hypothetical protein